MKTIWYFFIKIIVKLSLFFYTKKIKVIGKKNIPNKGAILFVVNHPNGLIDPLLVAVNNPRIQHFLVRAAIFKKPLIRQFLSTLNLMPIYRIRDGIQQLGKNQKIFEQCFSILNSEKTLMIFPEGGHDKRRTIRPLSKGFLRIVFGALERHPRLKIQIIPVGITYDNPSQFPTKVCVQYGKPIMANDYYKVEDLNNEIKQLKKNISKQMESLSVHIAADKNYQSTLEELHRANVDFTQVNKINLMVKSGNIITQKRKVSRIGFFKLLIILNSFIPWLIWKYTEKNIDEFEFIDTFRYATGTLSFSLSYLIQSYIITSLFNWKIGLLYLSCSLILVLIYAKFHIIQKESRLG